MFGHIPAPITPLVVFLLLAPALPRAAEEPIGETAPEQFAVHGQFTYVEQETSDFSAPYRAANSLSPDHGRETSDVTLYLGARLGASVDAWVDAEIDEGFGLDDTLGVAGFPSGEAYKVGRNRPYFRLPRAFLRDTVNLGGERETVDAAPNQLGGARSADRVVLTLGKFSVADVFDTNGYAHDPRGDFLNWSAIDAGTFDYAADAWGYTAGVAAEWYTGDWTLRAGAFDLSNVPNSTHLDPGGHEFQLIGELEHRHTLAGRPGRVVVTAFESRGRMALLVDAEAIASAQNTAIDVVPARRYRSRSGIDLNLEQQLGEDLGAFARIGGAGGNVEIYEFTEIDRTLAAGLSLKGSRWRRPNDTVGLALVDNRISATRQQYLAAGGLGILIGDGQLPHPGPEEILETYYQLAPFSTAQLTLDYQRIVNPAYNRDRGPVSVIAVRVHAQF
jgi:high affinity Mn2+ porin